MNRLEEALIAFEAEVDRDPFTYSPMMVPEFQVVQQKFLDNYTDDKSLTRTLGAPDASEDWVGYKNWLSDFCLLPKNEFIEKYGGT